MPDTSDYLARIHDHAQSEDPLEMQGQTAAVLEELLANASDEQLTTRLGKAMWSIGEILAHLAEDEIASAWRYRQKMLEHKGSELVGFDQDLWARIGGYASRAPEESLALFRLLPNANLQMLRKMAPEQWECFGIHAERGSFADATRRSRAGGYVRGTFPRPPAGGGRRSRSPRENE